MPRITLTRYLIEQQREKGNIPPELRLLIESVAGACKDISHHVGKGALGGELGSAGTENVQGEVQKKLDIITNDIMLEANEWGGTLAAMASEEMDELHAISKHYPKGGYLLLFDPLDGSSNIDVNVSVGTIFSVLKCPPGEETEASFFQPGTKQVAAGYAVYGPQTMLILSFGHGVQAFTLDRDTFSWMLTSEAMKVPEETSEYAINASNQRHWETPVQRYIEELQQGKTGPRGRDFNMRWIASMVADVHRILTRGGVFLYPRDHRDLKKPGKLRLLYEANPMSFLIEQAGGASSTGRERILDIVPSELHQRVAVMLGSKNEVERLVRYHHDAPAS